MLCPLVYTHNLPSFKASGLMWERLYFKLKLSNCCWLPVRTPTTFFRLRLMSWLVYIQSTAEKNLLQLCDMCIDFWPNWSSDQGCQMVWFWVNFGGSCIGKCWYIFMSIWSILRPLEIFYGHLVYFVVNYFPVLVCCTKKNLMRLHTYIHTKTTLTWKFSWCAWTGLSIYKMSLS
jgi:hypothetical protein